MGNEKTYKTLSVVGGGNIALGIVILLAGISAGILMIVSGGRLLSAKKDLTF